MRAIFRCDASARIGGGHLRRCLTLSEALAGQGWRISFAMRRGKLAQVPQDVALSPLWIGLERGPDDEPDEIAAAIGTGGADLLVVDHYRRDRRFEAACRQFARSIAVIDDLADRPHDADLLLDQTFGRAEGEYLGLVPEHCRILCGSGYALLRPEFAAAREAAVARRRMGGPVQRILIAMGAADADDLTSAAIAAVEQVCERLGRRVALDVVLGAGAPHLAAVRHRLSGIAGSSIHVGASGAAMANLMAAADLAIGAAGTTSWERCCLGLPTVAVVAAENQTKIAAELASAGACVVVAAENAAPERIATAVEALCRDGAARAAMADAAAQVCDGAGAARAVQAIAAIVADAGRKPLSTR